MLKDYLNEKDFCFNQGYCELNGHKKELDLPLNNEIFSNLAD